QTLDGHRNNNGHERQRRQHFGQRESAAPKLVAAGILPAVEPGVPPGGNGAGTKDPKNSGPDPGGKMPPSTAGGTPVVTSLVGADAPSAARFARCWFEVHIQAGSRSWR